MISEAEQYHGIVLRQLILGAGRPLSIALVDSQGRRDCFRVDGGAFQVKYSTRRLSPWQFSFTVDQLHEIATLARSYRPVWLMLVCGIDGVVALSSHEFIQLVEGRPGGVLTIRVSRKRNEMYRVSGNTEDSTFTKSRGVGDFLSDLARPL